jgi:hypothetical protein
MAAKLSDRTGQSFTAGAVRQKLRRARIRFAELLIDEIADGLANPSPDEVEAELIDLGLFDHVRDLLPPDWKQQRAAKSAPES